MKLLVLIAVVCLVGTTNSLTYPTFKVKRYNRGIVSPRLGMSPNVLKQPVYEDGYLTNNGYYYYPHHEYHSYGMPTYHGEYKPKAYYYSAGPSYNYYNDRELISNPLDDLHEEILQENEQERQSDLHQRDDYDDDYYFDPNEKLHDAETTNNFLRNMMEYNRQNERQQRLQQLQYKHRQQIDQQPHQTNDDYFSDIEVNPDDYQFEPQGEENFDLQRYWDAELLNANKDEAINDNHFRRESDNVRYVNNEQDVKDLKSLPKQEPDNLDEDYKKRYHTKEREPLVNSWTNSKSSSTSSLATKQKDFEDDFDNQQYDYDDGSWINWDRKRSLNAKKLKPKIEARKRFLSIPQNKEKDLNIKSTDSTTMGSTTLSSIGQKETYPLEESVAAKILDEQNEENNNRKYNPNTIEKSIYNTIKKMITIEQELKKNGSKQKRNTNDAGSVVKQLESLKKHNN